MNILIDMSLFLSISASAITPAAGWKTLTSKNGWSIQYPNNWQPYEDGSTDAIK